MPMSGTVLREIIVEHVVRLPKKKYTKMQSRKQGKHSDVDIHVSLEDKTSGYKSYLKNDVYSGTPNRVSYTSGDCEEIATNKAQMNTKERRKYTNMNVLNDIPVMAGTRIGKVSKNLNKEYNDKMGIYINGDISRHGSIDGNHRFNPPSRPDTPFNDEVYDTLYNSNTCKNIGVEPKAMQIKNLKSVSNEDRRYHIVEEVDGNVEKTVDYSKPRKRNSIIIVDHGVRESVDAYPGVHIPKLGMQNVKFGKQVDMPRWGGYSPNTTITTSSSSSNSVETEKLEVKQPSPKEIKFKNSKRDEKFKKSNKDHKCGMKKLPSATSFPLIGDDFIGSRKNMYDNRTRKSSGSTDRLNGLRVIKGGFMATPGKY